MISARGPRKPPYGPDEGWSSGGGRGQGEDRGGVRASAVVKDRVPFSTRGKGTRFRRTRRGPTQPPFSGATRPVRRRERPVAPSLAPSDGYHVTAKRPPDPGGASCCSGSGVRGGRIRRTLIPWPIRPTTRTSWSTPRPWTAPGGSPRET
ncbi:hypothetical protein GCM10010521_34960 [Streptomyces rameus]|uniref:Uncharacterized protein n=1 Tax=Streptomyces rameus TaxID=68261 RepID=A0ABP6NG74_9ACTN